VTGDYFHVIDPALTSEKIKVTAISGSGPSYTWTVVRGDEGTAIAHTSGFTIQQAVTANDFASFTSAFSVMSYGAKGDGSTDDTTAITNALNAAGALGAGCVYFPEGTYITGKQFIPQNVRVQGAGILATTVKLKTTAGQFDNLFMNAQDIGSTYDANCCQVFDMTLDGQSGSQSAGSPWQAGLVFSNRSPSGSFEYVDGRHQASNLLIQNFTGDGLVQTGTGACQFSDIQVWLCNGFGINVDTDGEMSNCDVGACGLCGIIVQDNYQLTGCKSWFSGAALTSTRGTGATATTRTAPSGAGAPPWDGGSITGGLTFSLANGYGNGFNFTNISGTSVGGNYSGVTGSALYAQDNARAGYYCGGGKIVLSACDADSNSNNGTSSGTTPLASFAGFEFPAGNAYNSSVSGVSWDRAANTSHQQAAVFVGGSGNSGLEINLVIDGTLNDNSTPMPALLSGSTVPTGVNLRIGTPSGTTAAVTQPSTPSNLKSNPVTLNNLTGKITMSNAALASAAIVTFTLTNVYIASGDILALNHSSAGTAGAYTLNAQCGSGSATVNVRNATSGSLSEAIVISFAVIKGVTS
jgi:hypothetical protein